MKAGVRIEDFFEENNQFRKDAFKDLIRQVDDEKQKEQLHDSIILRLLNTTDIQDNGQYQVFKMNIKPVLESFLEKKDFVPLYFHNVLIKVLRSSNHLMNIDIIEDLTQFLLPILLQNRLLNRIEIFVIDEGILPINHIISYIYILYNICSRYDREINKYKLLPYYIHILYYFLTNQPIIIY